jgi:molybdopterin converting factor small subunit
MQIHVQLFSILRDCLPPDAEGRGPSGGKAAITLPEGASLEDVVRYLGIDQYLGYGASELTASANWQVMVSGQFELDMGRVLQDGDEVQIFPPISGG